MIKFIISLTVALASIVCQAQVSENRTVGTFSKIDVETGISVVFTESKINAIQVEADNAESLGKILTEVKDNVLKIHLKSNTGRHNRNKILRVAISGDNVNNFKAGSGASVKLVNGINVSNATINLDSGAAFTGNINAAETTTFHAGSGSSFKGKITTDTFKAKIDSGAAVHLSGKAKTATFNTGSGASCHAEKFTAATATVNADSASVTDITVTEYLKANASSTAVIRYYGNPKKVDAKKDSLGVISKK